MRAISHAGYTLLTWHFQRTMTAPEVLWVSICCLRPAYWANSVRGPGSKLKLLDFAKIPRLQVKCATNSCRHWQNWYLLSIQLYALDLTNIFYYYYYYYYYYKNMFVKKMYSKLNVKIIIVSLT